MHNLSSTFPGGVICHFSTAQHLLELSFVKVNNDLCGNTSGCRGFLEERPHWLLRLAPVRCFEAIFQSFIDSLYNILLSGDSLDYWTFCFYSKNQRSRKKMKFISSSSFFCIIRNQYKVAVARSEFSWGSVVVFLFLLQVKEWPTKSYQLL